MRMRRFTALVSTLAGAVVLVGAASAASPDPLADAKELLASETVKSAGRYLSCRAGGPSRCSVQGARFWRDCTALAVANVPSACDGMRMLTEEGLFRLALTIKGISLDDPTAAFRGRSFEVQSGCEERTDVARR